MLSIGVFARAYAKVLILVYLHPKKDYLLVILSTDHMQGDQY